jgi:hypothetical protein
MKRITSVLIAVLLGAITTGIGVVPFLVLANHDRNRLTSELEETRSWAERAESEKERLAREANEKVEEANIEIQRAQMLLEQIEEDRRLTAEAKLLSRPSSRELPRWDSYVSLYQEVKFSIPPNSSVNADTKQSLTVTNEGAHAELLGDARWLAITPYDPAREQELFGNVATSTGVSYLVDDYLLIGRRGSLKSGEDVMALTARHAATSTHIIWMKDPGTLGSGDGFERFLGTLEFNS